MDEHSHVPHGEIGRISTRFSSFGAKQFSTLREDEDHDFIPPAPIPTPITPGANASSLRMSFRGGVALSWDNVTVTTKDGNRVLLKGVSGAVKGHLLAIMGPSGCGKTTLMNVLACRSSEVKQEEGGTRLNGQEYSGRELKKIGGYVMQDDLLNVFLTVEETLKYTARLRLPNLSEEEKNQRIEDVIDKMGIERCRKVYIGDALRKGISGGERKRLCVAMELLTNPQILFLDEPTSGLDSVTALSLITTLSKISRERGCTVVCTIHQPQSKIFDLFDDVLLLARGMILYHGPRREVIEYFENCGFPCPPNTNPADHIIDIAVMVQESTELQETFRPRTQEEASSNPHSHEAPLPIDWSQISWITQFTTLFQRCVQEQLRNRFTIIALYVQMATMAALIGGVFFKIGTNQASISPRQSVLFFCCVTQGIFAALQTINSFPAERLLVLRERASGMYKVSAYYMAKMMAEIFSNIFPPILFGIIAYPMIGLQPDVAKWFTFTFFLILCSMAATSQAIMISALCKTTHLSCTVLPMVFEISRLFGGFFSPPSQLPTYYIWLDALSYLKYSYVALGLNENTGLTLYCLPSELNVKGVCPTTSGQQTIENLGLNKLSLGLCAFGLLCIIFGCRFIGFLGLRFLKK